ncbi:M56 family metallopeptidase [Gimesia algae]|uniref:Regulatory protein BlaR1 n=1 Tax=Gimesia algae TaxID=2527971 RepID=A0A517VA30_9PLAN|nr:M56 family metallopeptidase [Gimesia algae]QDT89855.1 Regulatory protein BlaR1 [Gimesia algae]
MISVEFLFDLIVRFSLPAFCLLGVSLLLLQRITQPLERVRLIQLSLSILLAVLLLINFSWLPAILVPILPAETTVETLKTPAPDVSSIEPEGVHIAHNIPPAVTAETTIADVNEGASLPASTAQASVPRVKSARGVWQTVQLWTVAGFVFISAVQLVYLLTGLALTWRLLSQSTPLTGSSSTRVRTLFAAFLSRIDIRFSMSDRIQVPLVCGVFRPTILLPRSVVEGPDELVLQHSLAYEWSHIQRRDLMTWQLASLCQILLWPQPFFWKLKRELRLSQDQIADQFAACQTDQPAEYAATLVAFSQQKVKLSMGALTMAETRSSLYRRVEMLLNDSFQISGRCRIRIVLAVLAGSGDVRAATRTG